MIKKILYIFIVLSLFNNLFAKSEHFKKGIDLYNENKFEDAKFKFEQDIVFNPKSEKSYLYLSKIYNKQNKKDLEKKNLKTVILLNPKNEEATYNLVKLKFKESDFSGSKELIENLLDFCKEYCQKSIALQTEIENSIKK